MQLHFQTVRRNLQALDALSCGYRLAIGIGIAHHHGDAVAQHGAVDDIGRCLAFGSACFLAGSRVKIAGIGKFGVLLQGHIIAACGGNRQAVTVNGGMILLIARIALYPHTDSGLQRLPILHGADIYTQSRVNQIALANLDFLVAAHDLDRLSVPGFRQNVAGKTVRHYSGSLTGVRIQLDLHPGSDLLLTLGNLGAFLLPVCRKLRADTV